MQVIQLADESSTRFSYLVADDTTRRAILIDPSEAFVERDLAILRERDLELVYIAETRMDPASGAMYLRQRTGARIVAADLGTAAADIIVRDGDVIEVGTLRVQAVEIPNREGVSYRVGDQVFLGDAVQPTTGSLPRRWAATEPAAKADEIHSW